MQPVWWATAIICALFIGTIILHLVQKHPNEQSRWAWWKEFHQRTRRYPTPEEVEVWMSQQDSTAQ